MRRAMTWGFITAAALAAHLMSPASVKAAPIMYQYSAIASGFLGGSPFVDDPVTITAIGDTTLVTESLPGIFFNDASATVTVTGIGSGAFTNATVAVANQNFVQVGVSDRDQNQAILFSRSNPAYATYDLTTAIGPLTGAQLFNPGLDFPTTAGDFILNSVGTVTFQATIVPETSTITLAGVGGLVLMALVWRKRRIGSGPSAPGRSRTRRLAG